MRVESDGHSKGNPRLYELIQNTPKANATGAPTAWAWPQIVDFLKVAGAARRRAMAAAPGAAPRPGLRVRSRRDPRQC